MLVPYCASTAADSRELVDPLPKLLSGLVNSVPVLQPQPSTVHREPSEALPMSVVYVLPRVGSLSWYVVPDSVSWSGTVPPYSDWPEPSTVSICCSVRSTAPLVASTYVSSRLGVPSDCTPPLVTCQASFGEVPVASTTSAAESAVAPRMSFV